MEVDIHIPCVIDQFYPEMGFSMLKVLEKAGVTTHYHEGQTCCGQLAFVEGFWEEAKILGEKLITEFSNNRMVVSASPACLGYIKSHFDELFYNGAYHNEYRQLQRNVFEITDFLVNVLNKTTFGATFNHKVAFVENCAATRSYGQKNEPLQLLRNVHGLTLVNLENCEDYCGFSGMFANRFEPIAVAMSKQVVENAINGGAEYLVSNDPGCLLHLDTYIKKQAIPLKIAHVVDVLASGY
ncbi:MAG: Fe-S oxidoreductase [Bacteroidetes bacterium HGW-Bacteroidetes-16]|jgi:L-lactate dehydrogenase complex protein LldE|nr:MAG: Fe-S oxidoreductase [Bacteroidetes bacterium HGW-Bacteroidetes-16]